MKKQIVGLIKKKVVFVQLFFVLIACHSNNETPRVFYNSKNNSIFVTDNGYIIKNCSVTLSNGSIEKKFFLSDKKNKQAKIFVDSLRFNNTDFLFKDSDFEEKRISIFVTITNNDGVIAIFKKDIEKNELMHDSIELDMIHE